jgi:organic radical activating enzyme
MSEIKGYKAKSVVLTGGEPALVEGMPELVAELKRAGYWIAVETNATIDADWFAFIDYVACSPKVEEQDKVVLRKANEVRVVASTEEAVEFCKRIKELIDADDYYVSPCDRDGEIDFPLAKSVLAKLDGWSLSVQLHKILGFR